jgi:hypothetical protein
MLALNITILQKLQFMLYKTAVFSSVFSVFVHVEFMLKFYLCNSTTSLPEFPLTDYLLCPQFIYETGEELKIIKSDCFKENKSCTIRN